MVCVGICDGQQDALYHIAQAEKRGRHQAVLSRNVRGLYKAQHESILRERSTHQICEF